MSKKKILTLEKQKHLYNSLVEIFKDLDQDEIDQILQNLGLDSFIQNAGIYSLNIKSSAPTYIIDNYNITLTANLYSYFLDVTDKVLSWQWERNSGNTAEDSLWKVGKTNSTLELTEADFPRLDSTDIEFKLTAVTEDGVVTDTILFTKFQKYSKLQIVAVTGNVFLENNPNTLSFETSITGFTVCNTCYEWYLDEVLISTNATVRIPYDLIEPSKVAILKVVVQDNNGNEHEDYTSIARIMNGQDASTPYTLDLTNDSVTIPANTDGSISGSTAFYSAVTEAKLYFGSNEVSTNDYYVTVEASTGITMIATNNNRSVAITGMSNTIDSGYVKFSAYDLSNKLLSTTNFSINKVKGTPTYQLTVTPNSVKLNQKIGPGEQRFTPGNIQVAVIKNDGSNITTDHSGLVKYRYQFQQENGSTSEDGDHTLPVNGIVDLLDEIEEAEALAAVAIQFRLYHPTSGQICDVETVPIIKDGLPGITFANIYKISSSNSTPPEINRTATNPEGWSSTPPAVTQADPYLWLSVAQKYADNGELIGTWSVPVQITGPQGPQGEPGYAGVQITLDNPVQAIAVGSDNVLNFTRTYRLNFYAYSGVNSLTPVRKESDLADNEFFVDFPGTIAHAGITLYRVVGVDNAVDVIVSENTSFVEGKSITISFPVKYKMNDILNVVNINFILTPISKAEDAMSLSLNSNTTVVKCDKENKVTYPNEIILTAIQQGYNDVITWEAYKNGITRDNSLFDNINLSTTQKLKISSFNNDINLKSVKVRIFTSNGLFDEISIVRVTDGYDGVPGINGTVGPTPRLLEWVAGVNYQKEAIYKDFVYYRPEGSERGWYTVRINAGETLDTIAAQGGKLAGVSPISNTNFVKVDNYTELASFGTVIAEQANIAGFIFRNQVLNSQAVGTMSNCHPTPGAQLPNLSLDGLQGIIKFLDKMILNKNGMTFKDDCGRPRMVFKNGDNGIPILKFLDENGATTWEAGQSGYIVYMDIVPDSYTPISAVFKESKPNGSSAEFSSVFNGRICYINNQPTPSGNKFHYHQPGPPPKDVIGYLYNKGISPTYTSLQNSSHGKMFATQSNEGPFVPNGYYMKSFYAIADDSSGFPTDVVKAEWTQILDGVEYASFEVTYQISLNMQMCTQEQQNSWETSY